MDAPSLGTLVVFLVTVVLCLALLGWWIVFQIGQTSQMVELQRQALLSSRFEAANAMGSIVAKIKDYPGLSLVPAADASPGDPKVGDFSVSVRPESLAALERWHREKLWMFISEGSFFVGLLVVGLALMYRTFSREVALHRQQANFVAAVTHELKSPLASLRLYLETFQMGRVAEPAALRRYSGMMLGDVGRLEQLVGNLLEAARLDERGGAALRFETLCLSSELPAWLEEIAPACEQRGARLELGIQEGLWARVDRDAMLTVLRNLVDNALKYSAANPEIGVRLEGVGNEARLSVRDRGIGVESRDLERIFERFYRVGDEMTRSIRGTGLGLYLVRELVRAQGGRVWAESEGRGQGLNVVIALPLEEGASP